MPCNVATSKKKVIGWMFIDGYVFALAALEYFCLTEFFVLGTHPKPVSPRNFRAQ